MPRQSTVSGPTSDKRTYNQSVRLRLPGKTWASGSTAKPLANNFEAEMIDLFDEDFGLSRDEMLSKISSQLGANYNSGEITVNRYETEYLMYHYLGVSQGARLSVLPFFEIKSTIPYSHPYFTIRKSELTDWVIEHVLSMPDYQIGDADFDTKFYIKVGDKDWGSKFFSKDIVRQGISTLFLQGFDVIRSEDGYLKVVKYGDSYPKVEMISKAIEQINQIISNVPNDYGSTATSEQNDKKLSRSSINDFVEANHELMYGQMDKKTMQRMWLYVLILIIVGVIAYGRLIVFLSNPLLTP
ncbi:MAG: hypothetical protein WC007_12210 [Pelobacteraceae bacterium]